MKVINKIIMALALISTGMGISTLIYRCSLYWAVYLSLGVLVSIICLVIEIAFKDGGNGYGDY